MIFGRCGRFFSIALAVKKTASIAMKKWRRDFMDDAFG
jgi:hypothetical protein